MQESREAAKLSAGDLSADVLAKVAAFLRSLSPDEVEGLASGRARLSLEHRDRRQRSPAELNPEQVSDVLARLRSFDSREDGALYLTQMAPTRANLAALARALDIPVPKADSVAKVRERIIEATIGYKLRSDAVRGSEREGFR